MSAAGPLVAVVFDAPLVAEAGPALLARLRTLGLRLGATAADTRATVTARPDHGPAVDALVCTGDLPAGRPGPLLLLRCLDLLGGAAPHGSVKVDGTADGLREGHAAGVWTVAVGPGEALPPADYRISTLDELPPVLERIAARLDAGEIPPGDLSTLARK